MSSGPLKTRSATLEDLPTLLAFEQGIIEAERPYDHTLGPDPLSYYDLGELIGSPNAEVAIVELQGEIVASGYAKKKKSLHYVAHDYHAFLGFMFVKPEHRGKGINQKLIAYLLAWAKKNNLPEVQLTVYEDNLPAIRAYEKIGFSKYLQTMRINLDEDETTS